MLIKDYGSKILTWIHFNAWVNKTLEENIELMASQITVNMKKFKN